jgi:hypothetical protein
LLIQINHLALKDQTTPTRQYWEAGEGATPFRQGERVHRKLAN